MDNSQQVSDLMGCDYDSAVAATVLHQGHAADLPLAWVTVTSSSYICKACSVGTVAAPNPERGEISGSESHHQVVVWQFPCPAVWVVISTHQVEGEGGVHHSAVGASLYVGEGGGAGAHHNAGQLEFYRRVRERAVPDERVKRGSSMYSMYSLYSQSPEVDGVEVGDDVAPGGSETEVKPLVETVVDHDEYLRVDGARVVLAALPPPGHIEAVRESLVVS